MRAGMLALFVPPAITLALAGQCLGRLAIVAPRGRVQVPWLVLAALVTCFAIPVRFTCVVSASHAPGPRAVALQRRIMSKS